VKGKFRADGRVIAEVLLEPLIVVVAFINSEMWGDESMVVTSRVVAGVEGDEVGDLDAVEVGIGVSQAVMGRAGEDGKDAIGPLGESAFVAAVRPGLLGSSAVLLRFPGPSHELAGLEESFRLVEVAGENTGGVIGLAKLRR